MKLYALFYLSEKDASRWNHYGSFTTLELAEDLEAYIRRSDSISRRKIMGTRIVEFCEGKLISETLDSMR